MLRNLLVRLWNDESGVISTEYLMLGSIVAVGSASGLATMRDSVNDEFRDYGQSLHQARQQYSLPPAASASGSRGGTRATNSMTPTGQYIPMTPTGQYTETGNPLVPFSSPTPTP